MSAKDHRVSINIQASSNVKETVELENGQVILGDFSKKNDADKGKLKDRPIHMIKSQRDFKATLQKINPKLTLSSVTNLLVNDPDAKLKPVELSFSEMKDFHPDEIVKHVEPLKELMAARERLKKLKMVMLKDSELGKTIGKVLNSEGDPRKMLLSKLGV